MLSLKGEETADSGGTSASGKRGHVREVELRRHGKGHGHVTVVDVTHSEGKGSPKQINRLNKYRGGSAHHGHHKARLPLMHAAAAKNPGGGASLNIADYILIYLQDYERQIKEGNQKDFMH